MELIVRRVPDDLAASYRCQKLWRDVPLGAELVRLLSRSPRQRVRVHSRQTAISLDYTTLLAQSGRFAALLEDRGICAGEVVAIWTRNRSEALIALVGSWRAGACVLPIPPYLSTQDAVEAMLRIDAVAIVLDTGLRQFASSQVQSLSLAPLQLAIGDDEHLSSGFEPFGRRVEESPEFPRATSLLDPSAPVLYGMTAGTQSGKFGLCAHSANTVLAELAQLGQVQPDAREGELQSAPLGHAIGMLGAFLLPIWLQRPVEIMDAWDTKVIADVITDSPVTAGSGAPTQYLDLVQELARRGSSLGPLSVGLGGAPVTDDVLTEAERRGDSLVRLYGSTEHPSVSGSTHSEPSYRRLHTDGRPLAGVEIRVVRADGSDCAIGESGELLSRGPDCCVGRVTDGLDESSMFTADGWWVSGDTGSISQDGCLTIDGRIKDVVIRGGETISAASIESSLSKVNGVRSVAVVGERDDRLGEVPVAYVVLQPGAEPPRLRDLRRALQADGKPLTWAPDHAWIIGALPASGIGKVDKSRLEPGGLELR